MAFRWLTSIYAHARTSGMSGIATKYVIVTIALVAYQCIGYLLYDGTDKLVCECFRCSRKLWSIKDFAQQIGKSQLIQVER
jgi:hypothetical protein